MFNNYQSGVAQDAGDRTNIMGGYESYKGATPYAGFIKDGGVSDMDASSIRARAISPTRAVYQNAQNEIKRQSRLHGGYSPNKTAALAKTSRDLSSSLSDANTNAEGMIAQMRQQGKQFGTQGEVGRQMGILGGQTSLYGTTPAQAATFGNQVLQSDQNYIGMQGLQNDLALGRMGARTQAGHLQGPWQQGFNNTLSALETGKKVFGK
jgi:hypothetical protein